MTCVPRRPAHRLVEHQRHHPAVRHARPALELGLDRVLGDRSFRPWLEHQAQPVSVERTTAETMAVPLNFHGKNYRGSREVDVPTYLPTRWGGIRRGVDGPTYLPTRWGGIHRGVDGPTYLPTRWGGTCSHFPENQALQFHAPVRCSALPLPESALVRSASTVPVCPDRSRVKTTLSDAEVFCQTCT